MDVDERTVTRNVKVGENEDGYSNVLGEGVINGMREL